VKAEDSYRKALVKDPVNPRGPSWPRASRLSGGPVQDAEEWADKVVAALRDFSVAWAERARAGSSWAATTSAGRPGHRPWPWIPRTPGTTSSALA
jgi:hypothetical protein